MNGCCGSKPISMMLLNQIGGAGEVAPVNIVAPEITGINALGQVLTTDNGTWTGTSPITYLYQWQRDGVDIVGQTNSTHTIVTADLSSILTCVVTATNSVGSVSQVSNSILIVPAAPTASSATNITDVSFSANWLESTGATGYYLYLYQSDGTTLISKTDVGLVTTYSVTGRTQNTTYKYAVSAYNGSGEGALSGQTTVIMYDSLAWAFLTTTSLTANATIAPAIDFRMKAAKGLAGAGVEYLSKLYIDRPYVGGTATTHKYDLLNLQQCTFFGGFTHDANGVVGNGTDAYCDEGFNSSVLGQNTGGWAGYCNSGNATAITPFFWLVSTFEVYLRYLGDIIYSRCNSSIETAAASADSRGLFLMTRQDATIYNLFVRSVKSIISVASVASVLEFKTWCRWNGTTADLFSTRRMASQRFFNGVLSDAQAAAITADETTFQTMLGRNV